MGKKVPIKWDFRDVSSGIQKIRNFLLGRKYVYHNRFPPLISPRSIPPPDIPRGPDYKYSNQWYGNRNVLDSVKPPVVAPIAEGLPRKPKEAGPDKVKCEPKTMDTQAIDFPFPPTPGHVWWFDSHCYYKEVCVIPCATAAPPPPPPPPCPPPCPEPPPPEKPCPVVQSDPCAEPPPCKLSPCQQEKIVKPKPPPEPCDPCKPKGGRKKRKKC